MKKELVIVGIGAILIGAIVLFVLHNQDQKTLDCVTKGNGSVSEENSLWRAQYGADCPKQ